MKRFLRLICILMIAALIPAVLLSACGDEDSGSKTEAPTQAPTEADRIGVNIPGVEVVYAPDTDEWDSFVTEEQLDAVKGMMESRLSALHYGMDPYEIYYENKTYTDYEINADDSAATVTVRLPWPEEEFDPYTFAEDLAVPAHLEFRDPEGVVILTGEDLERAEVSLQPYGDQDEFKPVVLIELNHDGKRRFADATKQLVGQQIGIYLDDALIFNPTVQVPVTDGSVQISGLDSFEEAERLADCIKSISLPFGMKIVSYHALDRNNEPYTLPADRD